MAKLRAPAVRIAARFCPELKIYTGDEQRRAATELLALPANSIIAIMISDYDRERAELRACGTAQPSASSHT